jgi:hypothetical protein
MHSEIEDLISRILQSEQLSPLPWGLSPDDFEDPANQLAAISLQTAECLNAAVMGPPEALEACPPDPRRTLPRTLNPV